jgi:hypothetical protein
MSSFMWRVDSRPNPIRIMILTLSVCPLSTSMSNFIQSVLFPLAVQHNLPSPDAPQLEEKKMLWTCGSTTHI